MIFDRGTKVLKRRKDYLFNIWYWNNWISICKNVNFNPYLTPDIQVNSKSIIDLNAMAQTITFLKENIGENHCDLSIGQNFLYMTNEV